MSNHTIRVAATGAMFGMGVVSIVDGISFRDGRDIFIGLAMLFFVLVLGEKPWSRPKNGGGKSPWYA